MSTRATLEPPIRPVSSRSIMARMQATLWPTPGGGVLSAASAVALLWGSWHISRWLLIDAVPPWAPASLCAVSVGACWPFWIEKFRFLLFGTYPFDEQWRPALVCVMLIALTALCGLAVTRLYRLKPRSVAGLWCIGIVTSFVLMGGNVAGLTPVDTTRWNGLPLLLMLSLIAIALAFPLGVLLALGRYQDRFGLLKRVSALYIEFMRGVPMITLLFVGVFVLPLMLPKSTAISPFAAVMVALIAFNAAYFAEDVRSGLLSLPAGQSEAANALGLGFWPSAWLILLPQAIERALPALLNSTIGAYKDTSLVVVLGFHDLSATAKMAFADIKWGNQALEAYVFVAVWFLLSCSFFSWIGRRLSQMRTSRRLR